MNVRKNKQNNWCGSGILSAKLKKKCITISLEIFINLIYQATKPNRVDVYLNIIMVVLVPRTFQGRSAGCIVLRVSLWHSETFEPTIFNL